MAVIYGSEGADTKNGTGRNDTMYGWARGGNASSPSGNDTLNGLAGNDKLDGGTGNDSIRGSLGLDILFGGTGNDNLFGGSGNDKLYGQSGNDTLNGSAGDDTLNGGTGDDSLIGGTGNDTYNVDTYNDIITENLNQGIDTVKSSAYYYNLDANLENLTLTGNSDIVGGGNDLDNIIFGNSGNNIQTEETRPFIILGTLNGYGGNDKIYGQAGNDFSDGGDGSDTLFGGSGNDTLDGGTVPIGITTVDDGNKDTLIGGSGNDVYAVYSTTDTIIEYFNQGIDTVRSDFDYTLSDNSNLENLDLSSGTIGIGNSLDNTISGNNNNNYLYGLEGNDYLVGYSVSQRYGSDFSSDDYLDGGAGNDTLEGGFGSDSLFGGEGNDTLKGHFSVYSDDYSDTLTGGKGADNFVFADNFAIDTITDFVVADDTIFISAYFNNGILGDLTRGAAITPEQFVISSAAVDASDRFIYNKNTGALFFDYDGTGTTEQVQFASLSTGLSMTNANIAVLNDL